MRSFIKIVFTLALCASSNSFACSYLFDPKIKNTTELCKTSYKIWYDQKAKIPILTAYELDAKKAEGCEKRTNKFTIDKTLPKVSQSSPADYAKSGYDMGHMANAADMSWSHQAMEESFLMSNMTPQTPNFNRGIWKN